MRNPALATVGLVVVALLCVQLLRGSVALEAAAQRALLTVVVLALVDRVAVPLGSMLVGMGRVEEEPDEASENPFDDDDWGV